MLSVKEGRRPARGDGTTSDVQAIQRRLDQIEMSRADGELYFPLGTYVLDGPLVVPPHVALICEWGTNLVLTWEGEGHEDEAALTFLGDNRFSGFRILHPGQDKQASTPRYYPWVARLEDADHLIEHVRLDKPYRGILSLASRVQLADIKGRPLAVGVEADNCYDCIRVDDCQFSQWFVADDGNSKAPIEEWVWNNGIGFVFRGIDGLMVNRSWAFSYSIGKFFDSARFGDPEKRPSGQLYGSGDDACRTNVLVKELGWDLHLIGCLMPSVQDSIANLDIKLPKIDPYQAKVVLTGCTLSAPEGVPVIKDPWKKVSTANTFVNGVNVI